MNVKQLLWMAAEDHKHAMPILSFSAVQKLNVTVAEQVNSAQ